MPIQATTYTHVVAVTPSDSADIPTGPSNALLIGVGGTLKINDGLSKNTVTLTVPAGVLPIRVARAYATGTTATGIAALY